MLTKIILIVVSFFIIPLSYSSSIPPSNTENHDTPPLIAAGQNFINGGSLLVTSADAGKDWHHVDISEMPSWAIFYAANCSGSGHTSICVAAGEDAEGHSPPVLATSIGGKEWHVPTIANLPLSGYFNSVSCSGNSNESICSAVGRDFNGIPLLAVSNDAKTWRLPAIEGSELEKNGGFFYGVSCSGKPGTGTCIAVGAENIAGPSTPLLVISTNGGTTWKVKKITPNDTNVPPGMLYGASCLGNGSKDLCIAAGEDLSTLSPLLVESTDGGKNWNIVSDINGIPTTGHFSSASCSKEGEKTLCVAAGADKRNLNGPPLLTVSLDGGKKWTVADISGLPDHGYFSSVSCSGAGNSGICVAAGAAGNNYMSFQPLLVASIDGGKTWSAQAIPEPLTLGFFSSVNCSGSGTKAVCIASGNNFQNNSPMLVQTLDGAHTWKEPIIKDAPLQGMLYGTGIGK